MNVSCGGEEARLESESLLGKVSRMQGIAPEVGSVRQDAQRSHAKAQVRGFRSGAFDGEQKAQRWERSASENKAATKGHLNFPCG